MIEQVNDDRALAVVTSRHGNAVLIAESDYDAMEATSKGLHLPEDIRARFTAP